MNTNHITMKGMTLIELLVAIAIGAIVAGVIILILEVGLTSWRIGEADILIQEVGQRVLDELIEGSFELCGLREAVELCQADACGITFIPPWVDTHEVRTDLAPGKAFDLKKGVRPGSPPPLARVKIPGQNRFSPFPISFTYGSEREDSDLIRIGSPIPAGSRLKILYSPDADEPGVRVSYLWDRTHKTLTRAYYQLIQEIPTRAMGVKVTGLEFSYFDATSSRLVPAKGKHLSHPQLLSVSAVRVKLVAEKGDERRELSSFVNIRNLGNRGGGISIAEGSLLNIPDSKKIHSLILTNIGGVKNGDIIEIEAKPKEGKSWKISIKFGLLPESPDSEEKPRLLHFSVEYPPGTTLWSRYLNQPVERGLDLTELGNSYYDYDDDDDIDDVVILKEPVLLSVSRMDVEAAAIAILP